MKIHKQVYRETGFGGVSNETLCGRVSDSDPDGMNVGEKVTCKLCIKIMNDSKHWKNKNIITQIER